MLQLFLLCMGLSTTVSNIPPGIQQFKKNLNIGNKNFIPVNLIGVSLFTTMEAVGMNAVNTILGVSMCADQINNKVHGFLENFEFAKRFILGGLGGYPFAGRQGLEIMYSHVPEGGNAVIFYASHVGISQQSTIGKYNRSGQQNASSCCGAAVYALNQLQNPRGLLSTDWQQQTLVTSLMPHLIQLQRSMNKQVDLSFYNYKINKDQIDNMVNNVPFTGKILIVGGIILNNNPGVDQFIVMDTRVVENGESYEIGLFGRIAGAFLGVIVVGWFI